MKYFAYGSNMSISRLRDRIPNARNLGRCSLDEYDLRFHKLSKKDGSGKGDAYFTGDKDCSVIGVLFEIDPAGKHALDQVEGLGFGYEARTVTVLNEDREEVEATTYCATKIDKSLKPYSWYLNHVLIGAIGAGLPEIYIEKIRAIESIQDQNKNRDRRERAIHS